jgi:hypothetical protein
MPILRPRIRRILSGGRASMRVPSSHISPAAMRPGGSISPMIAAPVIDLPAPDSPTTPSTSPASMEKLTSSTATRAPDRVGNSTVQVADVEQGPRHLSFGFSASRSQSPSRLTDSASASSVTEGNRMIHHSPENRKSWPMRISVPRLGLVGGTPTPR